ncbi:MAG: hypothetical protein IKE28_01265 [Solobacterium sp.]|nr:hypothetical protein [Solobacterium sp.]
MSAEAQLLITDAWAGADNEGCFNIIPALKYRGLQITSDSFVSATSRRNSYLEPPLILLYEGIVYAQQFIEVNKGLLTSVAFRPSVYRWMLFDRYPTVIRFEENYLLAELASCKQQSRQNILIKHLKDLKEVDESLDLKLIDCPNNNKATYKPNLHEFAEYVVENGLWFDFQAFWTLNEGHGWKGDWKENCRIFAGNHALKNPKEQYIPKYLIEKKAEEFCQSQQRKETHGDL